MREVILKVERTLFPRGLPPKGTTSDGAVCDIALDDRTRAMMGGETRGYFRATIDDHGNVRISTPVKGQTW